MTGPLSVAAAERERDLARARVVQTMGALQDRLDPRTFARNATRDLTEAGSALADAGVLTVKRNPGAVAGITAVAGLFLARRSIAGLFRRKPKPQDDPYSLL